MSYYSRYLSPDAGDLHAASIIFQHPLRAQKSERRSIADDVDELPLPPRRGNDFHVEHDGLITGNARFSGGRGPPLRPERQLARYRQLPSISQSHQRYDLLDSLEQ